MSLPSYDAVIAEGSDASHLIGPYLNTASLKNIILVDKEYYTKYAKYLWEDPMARVTKLSRPFCKIYALYISHSYLLNIQLLLSNSSKELAAPERRH
jgi:hypothetical protein